MTVLLSKAGSKLTVKQLLDTLQETMEFEASIARKFITSVSHLPGILSISEPKLCMRSLQRS